MRAADIAMYDAKRAGRGTFRFFEKSMDAELRSRATLETDLRAAIGEGRIEPYYQPLVTIPGAGHFVQQDASDLVSRSMKMWLNR